MPPFEKGPFEEQMRKADIEMEHMLSDVAVASFSEYAAAKGKEVRIIDKLSELIQQASDIDAARDQLHSQIVELRKARLETNRTFQDLLVAAADRKVAVHLNNLLYPEVNKEQE